MFARDQISFRPLEQNDLIRMFHWLQNPDVARWYGPRPQTLAEVEIKYSPRIEGRKPVNCYIVAYDGHPVGYIQTYFISHESEYANALKVDRDATGVDLFIGETEFRYRGFGSLMLQEFLEHIVFSNPVVTSCVIAPEVGNRSAIRAYAKAGFRYIKTVNVPGEDEPEYVMMMWPDELDDRIKQLDRERSI